MRDLDPPGDALSGVTIDSTADSAAEEGDACPRCDGSGWVVVDGDGTGTARPCACRAERQVRRLVELAGLPERYRACSLERFRVSHPEAAVAEQLVRARTLARRYVDTFLGDDGRFTETGLLFVGPVGTGKTHLAVAVLRELIETYRIRGRFVDFTTLVHEIQATFDPGSPESKRQILDPVIEADLLVLDELGAQKPTAWVQDLLYYVINSRYTRRLPTLFTTNYSLEPDGGGDGERRKRSGDAEGLQPLAERIQAQLVSRLWEMTQPVVLDAVGDYRREIKMAGSRVQV